MAKVNSESSNTDMMRQHQMRKNMNTGSQERIKEVEFGVEESQGHRIFDFRLTKCLNARIGGPENRESGSSTVSSPDNKPSNKKYPATVKELLVPQDSDSNPCLISDADNQLLLNIVFVDKVNISAITIRCDERPNSELSGDDPEEDFQPPTNVHIFTNLESLDFSDIEDYTALEKKELVWDLENGTQTTNRLVIQGPKFQRCQSLQIFFVDTKDDAPYTFLNHVGITGTIAPDFHTQ